MINHLRSLAVFANVVEHGSLRAAAKALRLSPSVVSHHLTQLEENLGVALLYRSTRKLSLTRDGERLIGYAQTMLQAAEDGITNTLDNARDLSGDLHVTAPALLSRAPLANKIAGFAKENPKVHLSIDFAEDQRDMIAEGIDVAIRIGWLRDSQLKARKLYQEERVLLASAAYLKNKPRVNTPQDIEHWDWLHLSAVPLRPVFTHEVEKPVTLKPTPRLSANNASALYHLAEQGVGLVILPKFMAEEDLRSGKLHHLLPDWRLASLGVYAVRPQNSPRDGLASEFINALAQ